MRERQHIHSLTITDSEIETKVLKHWLEAIFKRGLGAIVSEWHQHGTRSDVIRGTKRLASLTELPFVTLPYEEEEYEHATKRIESKEYYIV